MTRRQHLGTIAMTTAFAVLIWLWAESENRGTRNDTAAVAFRAATDGDQYMIRVRDPNDSNALLSTLNVELSLAGPALSLERVAGNLQTVYVQVPNPSNDPARAFNLLEGLATVPRFQAEGITIERVDPPTLTLRIDEMLEESVPISVEAEGHEFESVATTPERITLRMPAETWQYVQATAGQQPVVRADLSEAALRRLQPGQPMTLPNVPLRLDPQFATLGESIEIQPASADITLTLANRLIETDWTVPVRVMMLPRDQAMFEVELEEQNELIRDVRVSGDAESIRRLKNREVFIHAVINLTSDELEQGIESKQIEWWLPLPGLSAELADNPDVTPEISFVIHRRDPQQPSE